MFIDKIHIGVRFMARSKDENKRQTILQSSKMLFSKKGFFNTSISDIVKETGLPVGSVYTYFHSKEEIVKVIVEEGWQDIKQRLVEMLKGENNDTEKLRIIVDDFFPEVLNDVDLINILLSEAANYTKIEDKMNELTTMIFDLLQNVSKENYVFKDFDRKDMESALTVYFLGVLNAVKLSQSTSIGITRKDIMRFIKKSISKSMKIDI
jgi:AcrR family transcriptional regulator